ncbi:hypothetical protein BH23GEM6_BH23GEM6_25840 [soil metagenome]
MSRFRFPLLLLFLVLLPPVISGASTAASAWENGVNSLQEGFAAPDAAVASAPIQVVRVMDGRKRQVGSGDTRPSSATSVLSAELFRRPVRASLATEEVRPIAERLPYHAMPPPAER